MAVVTVTQDLDPVGFELDVERFEDGCWITTSDGHRGFRPGPPTKVYLDGQVHWVQRRFGKLLFLPD